MCWFTRKPEYLEKHTATEDIKVLKFVWEHPDKRKRLSFISYFRDFVYTIGNLYETDMNDPTEYQNSIGKWEAAIIDKGFHSYTEDGVEPKVFNSPITIGMIRVHILLNDIEIDRYLVGQEYLKDLKILKCIIPKGAEYYLNEGGYYVSNKIIPKAFEDIPKVS